MHSEQIFWRKTVKKYHLDFIYIYPTFTNLLCTNREWF